MTRIKPTPRRRCHREGGQALTETAIILPLFLFMLLGTLQLGLIYQARSLLKYAAYRAVRSGALQHACDAPMKDAALAVLAPIMGAGVPLDGGLRVAAGDGHARVEGVGSYALALVRAQALVGPMGAPLLQVVVCGPTGKHLDGAARNGGEIDFDDPQNLLWAKGPLGRESLRAFERTKLRIQVQYLHQLAVPFANWILFYSWAGMNLMRELRMQRHYSAAPNVPGVVRTNVLDGDQGFGHRRKAEYLAQLVAHAGQTQRYFLPLHANYAFRMQSNLFPDKDGCLFPDENLCWHYDDGEAGAI